MPSNGGSRSRRVSKIVTQFIKDLETSKKYDDDALESPEPGEYAMVIERELGLYLIHNGVYPDVEHYCHKIYLVVGKKGKAVRKVAAAGTVIASVLTTNYTTKKELCKGLRSSFEGRGRRVTAVSPDKSDSRCPTCGHDTKSWDYLYETHFFSPDEYRTTSCCGLDRICCKCNDGTMSSVDTSVNRKSDDTPKTYDTSQFDEQQPKVSSPSTLAIPNSWPTTHQAIPPSWSGGEQSDTIHDFYYQHHQHNQIAGAVVDTYSRGFTTGNAAQKPALSSPSTLAIPDSWPTTHQANLPSWSGGEQSGTINNYYYQHNRHNYYAGPIDDTYPRGFTTGNATQQPPLLASGNSGKFEEIVDQVNTLSIDDKPAADSSK